MFVFGTIITQDTSEFFDSRMYDISVSVIIWLLSKSLGSILKIMTF